MLVLDYNTNITTTNKQFVNVLSSITTTTTNVLSSDSTTTSIEDPLYKNQLARITT